MCATVTLSIGVSVLIGWALDVPLLLSWVPGYVTQKANTAVCFVSGAGALLAHHRSVRDPRTGKLASGCAIVLLVIAGLTLAEYACDRDFGIDQLLVRDSLAGSGTSHPGRMAPNTAAAFVFLGGALQAARRSSPFARRGAQASTFAALFLVMIALVGYAYGAHVLVGLFSLTRMAVHTITGLLALGAGTLWLTSNGGWLSEVTGRGLGRLVARRLLPAAILIPFAVGFVTLGGYRAGLYDPAFGAALMAVVETVSFVTLVWLCSRSLNESERGRILAGQDELTGLLNRRGFLASAEERRLCARRLNEDALLLFIDLDGMKRINDTLGHAAGDRALVDAARILRATFRDGDVLARLGGDEFAVFASRATMQSAPWMLKRLEKHLEQLNGEPTRDFSLKLSTGVTPCLVADEGSLDELLERADARMYEQKVLKYPARSKLPSVAGGAA